MVYISISFETKKTNATDLLILIVHSPAEQEVTRSSDHFHDNRDANSNIVDSYVVDEFVAAHICQI